MRLKPGDRALVSATGRPVIVKAVSDKWVLVASAETGLQWTYSPDKLEAALPDDFCPL